MMIRIEVNKNGHYYSNNNTNNINNGGPKNHQQHQQRQQHHSVVRKNAIQNGAKVHLSEDLRVPKVIAS